MVKRRKLKDDWRSSSIILNEEDIDREYLNQHYKLVKYNIPQEFIFHQGDNAWKYRNFHVSYKEQVNKPYYFNPRKGLFVLYQPNDKILEFRLDFINDLKCKSRIIPFEWIGSSDLLKLFMSHYFYNRTEEERRICQGYYFAIAKKSANFATALKISISKNYDTNNEFFVKSGAKRFVKSKKKELKNSYPKYEIVTFNGISYFRQLRQSKIDLCKNEIWREQKTNINNRAKSDFYNDNKLDTSRCYHIYQFQNHFQVHLQKEKIRILPKTSEWKWKKNNDNFKEEGYGTSGLPLKQLKTVRVFDNRLRDLNTSELLNQNISIEDYIELLNDFSKDEKYNFDLTFRQVYRSELMSSDFDEPLLLIQDVTGREFDVRENLEEDEKQDNSEQQKKQYHLLKQLGFKDPKNQFYNEVLRHIPKQSLTVNTNKYDYDEYSNRFKKYFDYPLFLSQKEDFEVGSDEYIEADKFINKIKVCLNELYLKNMLIKKIPINIIEAEADLFTPSYRFPCSPLHTKMENFLFVHKGYLMYVEDKHFKFINRVINKEEFVAKVKNVSSNQWGKIIGKFKKENFISKKHQNENENDEKFRERQQSKINNAFFIITPNHIVEIVQSEEYLLPNIDEILEQKKIREGDNPSVRGYDYIGCLAEINYNEDNYEYSVGVRGGLKRRIEKGNPIRRLKFYSGNPDKFDFELILESLLVRFVRNEKYTVYPYPFDLIKLYAEIEKS